MNDSRPPMDDAAPSAAAALDAPAPAAPALPPGFDPDTLERGLTVLRARQSLVKAVLAGTVAGVVAACAWALFTALTHYQIGYLALAIGALVGFAVRFAGRGMGPQFRVLAAVLSCLSCVLGNLLTALALISTEGEDKVPFLELLGSLTGEIVVMIMHATFQPMDVLFYALAAWIGFKTGIFEPTIEQVQAAALGDDLPSGSGLLADDRPVAPRDA